MSLDLNHWRIGLVVPDNPKNQLRYLQKMVITISGRNAQVEILSEERKGGRVRISNYRTNMMSLPRYARELALKWKILRHNIEIIDENN